MRAARSSGSGPLDPFGGPAVLTRPPTLGSHRRGNPLRVVVTSGRPDEQRHALGFGVRAILAGVALGLVAVPFGLLLFLVEDKWSPLLRVDDGARDGLHAFVLQHPWFVVAMETL